MKKLEALVIESSDIEDARIEGETRPLWKLKPEVKTAMDEAELVLCAGQVVKNRFGRTTSDIRLILEKW